MHSFNYNNNSENEYLFLSKFYFFWDIDVLLANTSTADRLNFKPTELTK